MVQIVLDPGSFENNRFEFSYGDRDAVFIIVDECFENLGSIGRINRILIIIYQGDVVTMCTTIIGFGDGFVGIKSGNAELRGKLLNV